MRQKGRGRRGEERIGRVVKGTGKGGAEGKMIGRRVMKGTGKGGVEGKRKGRSQGESGERDRRGQEC